MAFSFSDKIQLVEDILTNIEKSITTLQERTKSINSVEDFLNTPWGVEKLDAVCMVLIALGESIKGLDKITNKELLPHYPSIRWKDVMGVRDIIAHHYFEIDAEEIYYIIKNDIEPLKSAIQFLKAYIKE